jgi:hypothetical protein
MSYIGYVKGVVDLALATGLICAQPTADISGRQLFAVVSKYVLENPARWSRPARQLVLEAVIPMVPCSK